MMQQPETKPLSKTETSALSNKCPFHNIFSPTAPLVPEINSTHSMAAASVPGMANACPAAFSAAAVDSGSLQQSHDCEANFNTAASSGCLSHLADVDVAGSKAAVLPTNYDAFMGDMISGLKAEGRYRHFRRIVRKTGELPRATADDTPNAINWCSNDYLCMGQTPEVLGAAEKHSLKQQTGMSGIPSSHHLSLEKEVAALHGKDAAMVFNSCYTANEAGINGIVQSHPGCTIISDSSNHASMIQGIRQSEAPKLIWQHNDLDHLEALLSSLPRDAPKLVIFESVYSMDGSVAPIAPIIDLCERYNAMSFLDEVHAVGLYGHEGAGVAQRDGVMDRVDAISGTLGKAYGVIGGYVALRGNLADKMKDYVLEHLPYQTDTFIPPPMAEAARISVRSLRGEIGTQTRAAHQGNAALLKSLLVDSDLSVQASSSHIVPLLVGDATKCKEAADMLLHDHSIYVQPINYPTVARGSERLRFTPGPLHTPKMQTQLIKALTEVWEKVGINATMQDPGIPLPACSKFWSAPFDEFRAGTVLRGGPEQVAVCV